MLMISSFVSGFIFALGLVISGMTDPYKVIGFLDVFGEWNYALAFVMGGAVLFNLVSFKLIKRRQAPLFSEDFHWPTLKGINLRLILGAAIFGVGWGLVGICPGPGIVNLVTLDFKIFVFVCSMIAGMFLFHWVESRLKKD